MKTIAVGPRYTFRCYGFFVLVSLLVAIITFTPDVSYAKSPKQVNSAVGNNLCYQAGSFAGAAGRAIATIGICVVGVLALVGKITWQQAMIVGVGCAVIFGAAGIMVTLASHLTTTCK